MIKETPNTCSPIPPYLFPPWWSSPPTPLPPLSYCSFSTLWKPPSETLRTLSRCWSDHFPHSLKVFFLRWPAAWGPSQPWKRENLARGTCQRKYMSEISKYFVFFFHHETKPLIAMFNFGQWTWKSRPDLGEESLACILNCLVTNPSLDEGLLDDGGQNDWRDPTGPTRVAQETQLGWPDWVESVAQVKKQQGQQTPGQPVPHNPYDFFALFRWSVLCVYWFLKRPAPTI